MITQDAATSFWKAFDKLIRSFSSMNNVSGIIVLGKPDIIALEAVSRNEGLIMSEMARLLEIRFNTATGIADRLVEKKLLKREGKHGDRRVIRLCLTEKGRKTVTAYQRHRGKFFREMMVALTKSEQEAFVSVLVKIAGVMDKKKGEMAR
ncbi:MarR family transcriptional regulator [Candidatus Poribacteria bacterium]|nr:MarR family transcriptional regulator [Candidatus Poribacteria bacterium]